MIRRILSVLPGIGAAVLPNVTCPACWPAYTGFLSAAGLGFLMAGPYFYMTVGTMLTVSLFGMYHSAPSRRGYGPLLVGLLATTGILSGKATASGHWLRYSGTALLKFASIWNNWPKRSSAYLSEEKMTEFCTACKTIESIKKG